MNIAFVTLLFALSRIFVYLGEQLEEGGLAERFLARYTRTYIGSEISPDGTMALHATEGGYHTLSRYYELSVEDIAIRKTRTVYSGDPHTHNWEWTPDNKIKVTYNCGTDCLASKILDVNKHTSIIEFYRQKTRAEKNEWTIERFDGTGK